MTDSYLVNLYDPAGLYSETRAADWAECLSIVRVLARAEPAKVLCVFNADKHGYDCDGLADDERAAVANAVAEVRANTPVSLGDSIAELEHKLAAAHTLLAEWREEEALSRASGASPAFRRIDAIRGLETAIEKGDEVPHG